MKAIEILQQYWEQVEKFLIYARYCGDHDIQTIICRDFWLGTVYAAIGIGLLIALVIGKKALREQLEFYRNRKRLEARKIVAADETMEQAKPNVEAATDVDLSQEELAAVIRREMKARAEAPPGIVPHRADSRPETFPARELTTIMLTDMVGYSGSMERDEQGGYAKLLAHNEIVRTTMANYRGREIKTIGDAFLVTFRSAFDAVECALAIQRAFTEYNADKDVTDRILLRIGIHLGDILVTSNDVFGEGVNIVSRIQPLAEPGGICVSEAVFMQVRKKFELKVERVEGVDLKLKNIATAPDVYHLNLS